MMGYGLSDFDTHLRDLASELDLSWDGHFCAVSG